MRVLVTGGLGYKGTVLIPKLLSLGMHVRCIDINWFGNFLKHNKNLEVIQKDIININEQDLSDIDVIIHLSSVANDPCSDLDPKLTWEISCLATMKLADLAEKIGIKRIIYASSGSVYGVSEDSNVIETTKLDPISEYNKTKMCAERILLSYSQNIIVQIIRPATVCGYSPRMRLDVSVNLLTMQALEKKIINVFGGKQVRPNIHIDDITDVYIHFLNNPQITGIFNAGFENHTILEIAEMVSQEINADINITDSNDPRSYYLNSNKLLSTGYKPKKNIKTSILEMKSLYENGLLKNENHFHNLLWMQKNVFGTEG